MSCLFKEAHQASTPPPDDDSAIDEALYVLVKKGREAQAEIGNGASAENLQQLKAIAKQGIKAHTELIARGGRDAGVSVDMLNRISDEKRAKTKNGQKPA